MVCPFLCFCISTHTFIRQLQHQCSARLVEWVGSSTPVCKEHAETDGLEDTGQDTDGDGVEGALLSDNLGDDLKSWLGN